MGAIVSGSMEIKAPGNAVGDDGNWIFEVETGTNNFLTKKIKAGSEETVDEQFF